ncbi:ESX-1 secretion system protein eccD1 [Striga asiatica]|uniref:ESX-1 secretion system protein eccD1 n=1 Tax=Striga asiatica TaxID=4170 RepID=A0A5A7RCW2_STRAF|nr:ESX-1 secretion system protein eccD1 [Striga asiatica]
MVALLCYSHLPISLQLSSSRPNKPPFSLNFGARICSASNQSYKTRNRTTRRRSDFSDGADPVQESGFFNENGAVEDMDGYLNYLSLEYDTVWDTKPSWCQPWTIGLTGIGIITGSWLILNSIIVTSIVAVVICLWWYIFLYSYPKAYSDMIAERRKKVTNGLEDTYGKETEQ